MLNRYYESYRNEVKCDLKRLWLCLGDDSFETEVGRFDLLVCLDEMDRITKIEANFLLRVPSFEASHPDLFYAKLPDDLLHRPSNIGYGHRMSLTTSRDINQVSRLSQFVIEKQLKRNYDLDKSFLIPTNGVYETIDIPYLKKIRCTNFVHFPGSDFGKHGYIFKFAAVIPRYETNFERH